MEPASLAMLGGLLAGAGALFFALGFLDGATVRGDATNYTPHFIFACGSAFSLAFGIRAWQLGCTLQTTNVTQINFPFGVAVLSLLGSMYLLFTAADHWWFFRTPQAGVGSVADLGIPDVMCDTEAAYRCPGNMVFNANYSAPFVPWPDYEAGTSRHLKEKLDEILQSADEFDSVRF